MMAMMARLPSSPDLLLEYLPDIPDESDSNGDFDGYLDVEEGPVADRSASMAEFEKEESALASRRSLSLNDHSK